MVSSLSPVADEIQDWSNYDLGGDAHRLLSVAAA